MVQCFPPQGVRNYCVRVVKQAPSYAASFAQLRAMPWLPGQEWIIVVIYYPAHELKSQSLKIQHVALHHQLLDIYQLPKYMQSALILDNVYQKLQFVKCSFHNNYDDYVLCTACFRNSLRNTIRVCFLLKKMGWFLFFFLRIWLVYCICTWRFDWM